MSPKSVSPNRLSLAGLSTASALVAMLVTGAAVAAEDNPVRTRPKATEAQVTAQRVIVKFRQSSMLSAQATTNGESASTAAAVSSRMNALASRARINVQASRALGANMHVMQITPQISNETAAETLARLRADSDVEIAEIDRRVYPHAVSNDPLATGQWYLQNIEPSSINATGAWDTTKGSNGVVIAVIDTGVLSGHPDLRGANVGGRVLPGYDFVSGDPGGGFLTANDGNGRDSDSSDPGDWVSAADGCGDVGDSSWHGTRVSGIIGALTNNSSGIAGINWNGYILPVRVLGKCGGYNSDVLAGMRWAAGLSVPGAPSNPYPAQVLNISLGGEGSCDSASQAVVSEVAATGVVIVVSAGNEGGPVDSPANCTGAMGIVGLRHKGTKVGFSSLGPQIALGAPGGNCVNTTGGPCLFSIDTTSNAGATVPGTHTYTNQVDINVGTSFSSPIVSGIAGLMLAVNGNLKGRQLITRMQNGSTKPFPTTSDTGTPPVCHIPTGPNDIQNTECSCTTSVCGAGMANANGAVNEALRPIAAISVSGTVAPGQNITLQGGGSAAACNHTISTYAWTVVSGSVTLNNANTQDVTLQAPASGSAVVRLTVMDEAGKADTADITITPTSATSTAPTNAGSNACLTALSIAQANVVSITATDAAATEAAGDTGTFTVARTGDLAAAVTVNVAISGSATSADYGSLASSVTIAAGQSSATMTISPVEDTTVEGSESVTATIQTAPSTYEIGSPAAATVTIADNDTAAPPPTGDSNGGGGGGAMDLLTLLAALGAVGAGLRRRRATVH